MKKHAGKTLTFGIMASVFGLMLMGTTMLVDDHILGQKRNGFVAEILRTAGDASWAFVILGGLVLAIGTYMLSGRD